MQHSDELVGRDAEVAAIHAFLEARDALPAVLTIRGEPGIGKTSLWRVAVETARGRGLRVLAARPAGAEMRLAYAALADLLSPVAGELLPKLPTPQRRALEVALMRRDAPAAGIGSLAVATATAAALRAAAPVVVAIDDVQWLDAASADALAFAFRRLDGPIGVVLAARSADATPDLFDESVVRVERIDVPGLTLGALQRLLRVRLDFAPTRPALRRVHAVSGGNPFYALELARTLAEEPGGRVTLSRRLHDTVSGRLRALPDATRSTLVALAAAGRPWTSWGPELEPALAGGLVEVRGGAIDFAHPLLRAAVYDATSPVERREAHRRLADAAPTQEERARHLALAAEGADRAAAVALAAAGEDALRRGATLEAIDLYERALELTPPDDSDALVSHTLGAAEANRRAGDGRRGVELAGRAAERVPDGRLFAWLADATASAAHAERALEAAGDDPSLRAAALNVKAEILNANDDIPAALATAQLAVAAARDAGDRALLARALGAYGQFAAMTGDPSAADALREATSLEPSDDPAALFFGPSMSLGLVLLWRDELDSAAAIFESQRTAVVALGDEAAHGSILQRLARAELWRGNIERALALADEIVDLRESTGWDEPINAFWIRGLVRLHRGDLEGAREDAERALALAVDADDPDHFHVRHVLGAVELAVGNVAAAVEHLGRLPSVVAATGRTEPGICPFHADELEALVRAGSPDAVERIEEVEGIGRPRFTAAARRARGLLLAAAGDREAALAELRAAAATDVPVPYERARSLVALGAELRRARRRGEARTTLTEALATAERIGAGGLARQAREQLASVDGRAPAGGLTPAEARVAERAAAGLSTKQIAAELFVSPKTVENHLSRVYEKLGVRSRVELARMYGGGSEGESPIPGAAAAS